MKKKQFIRDLIPGGPVNGLFLLSLAQQFQARNGPYWRIEFKDASGSMGSKIWSPLSQQFPELKPGLLIEVQGRVVLYRDRNEIAVESMRLLDEAERSGIDPADFMPASSRSSESMLLELEELCHKTFSHAPWKKFYKLLFRDEEFIAHIRTTPAAKVMHHAYVGGLLEHTLGVSRLALSFAALYSELDAQMLLAGALCHDLGKMRELSADLVIEYTSAGKLLGHIGLGLEFLAPLLRKSGLEPELVEHLKHLVVSHHGSREFGSPCLPATAEALALHFADNLDAKLNQAQGALADLPEGEEAWSGYVSGLDRQLFKAARTPAQAVHVSPYVPDYDPSAGEKKLQESQCSLLLKE